MKKNPVKLHRHPVATVLTEDLSRTLLAAGYSVPKRLVYECVLLHDGRVTPNRGAHIWPAIDVNAIKSALLHGWKLESLVSLDRFLHYDVGPDGRFVRIGCSRYLPAEVLRVVALSDAVVRAAKGRRRGRTVAITRADGVRVPLAVFADGSIGFANTDMSGRPMEPMDKGQGRCPRAMVVEIGRIAKRQCP